MIDVIIPAYRGLEDTRRCVESVLAAACATPREVIVIDDASPEPELSAWLRGRARAGGITLRVHEANRGFVASANEGMALHPGRDVVLLNSDTEVAAGWLDRLMAHAGRDPAIGTLSPFSTNATILSYPRTLAANPLPAGETTASLDAAFAAANPGSCADIVTAVGFCMGITRACLDRVGPFDEARYGAGYGEEVDFCMRAARLGFRNVAAGDVFVRHVGEVSFGNTGAGRRAQAQATVDALYPEFQVRLREFIAADPLRILRRRADLERLRRSPRPRVLVDSEAAPRDPGAEVLMLRHVPPGHRELRWLREGEELALWFDASRDRDALAALLDGLGAGRSAPAARRPWPSLQARWLAPPAASSARPAGWRALLQAARRLLPRR